VHTRPSLLQQNHRQQNHRQQNHRQRNPEDRISQNGQAEMSGHFLSLGSFRTCAGFFLFSAVCRGPADVYNAMTLHPVR
jgi:hypothetical protein